MSYILDALKKADAAREREQGRVPGLMAQPVPVPAEHAPFMGTVWRQRAVLAAVAVGATLVTGLLWRTWQGGVAVAEAPPATATGPASAPPPEWGAAPPLTLLPKPGPDGTTLPRTVGGNVVPPRLEASKRDALGPTVARNDAAPSSPVASRVNPASVPPARAAAASGAASPAPLYTLQTLPDEIRHALPNLVVNGSMYSEQRSARMVVLNNQVFHEGDQPAPGLVLEEIRLKSAVFQFKGVRYLMSY